MRSIIVTSTFFFAVIQTTYGAAAGYGTPGGPGNTNRGTKRPDRVATLAHNMRTLPPATLPKGYSSTASSQNKGSDADEYLVLMVDDEQRPWPEIFKEMGYNTTRVKEPRDGHVFTAFADEIGGSMHSRFKTEEGTQIDAFGKSIRAFTMKLSESAAKGIASANNVAVMEKNGMAYASVLPQDEADLAMESENYPEEDEEEEEFTVIDKRQERNIAQQRTAPWNLQRVSSAQQVDARGRRATDLNFNYRFDQAAGSGVDVYVLDTGINTAHNDFGGRATMGFSGFGNNFQDDGGHGSHCSGTIGGRRFGVAKNVNLIGAKVLAGRGSGPFSAIMGGLEFAYRRHLQRMNEPDFKGSVISMSLGGQGNPATVLRAMEKASNAGMHFSVAAGNDNTDACGFWPAGFSARIPILTVGASDINDNRARFSNFGRCVDIHAPGVAIVSSHNRGPDSITSMQGTSMACPAVSGMIADELVRNPDLRLDPRGMKKLLLSKAIRNVVKGTNNAPNMLNNGLR
ncbi:Cerevisin [Dactylellina cionopaga]|nr:Cerevisin [Dactylellina cionopaga]